MKLNVITNRPALYRKLSEPFANSEDAYQALQRFVELVSAAREACKIPDCSIIVAVNAMGTDSDGEPYEGVLSTSVHLGDSSRHDLMIAEAYGAAVERRKAEWEQASKKARS